MSPVYCYDCRYFKRRFENYFDGNFTQSGIVGAKWSQRKFLMPYALCRREECFELIDGKKMRVRGQAQLNKNCDCPYFKKKWFKFT
jgi:hypothetical protein